MPIFCFRVFLAGNRGPSFSLSGLGSSSLAADLGRALGGSGGGGGGRGGGGGGGGGGGQAGGVRAGPVKI